MTGEIFAANAQLSLAMTSAGFAVGLAYVAALRRAAADIPARMGQSFLSRLTLARYGRAALLLAFAARADAISLLARFLDFLVALPLAAPRAEVERTIQPTLDFLEKRIITNYRASMNDLINMMHYAIISYLGISAILSFARLTLVAIFCMWIGAPAFAESDPRTRCGDPNPDIRIVGCTEIIARGTRETKRSRITSYINRSAAYRARGDSDRAIADLDKALQLDPKSARAFTERASIYHEKGDIDRAIADYDSALRFDKNSATAHVGRAIAYRDKGDLDKALADFDAALKLDPKRGSLYVDRGAIYRAMGNLDQAIADYDDAIKRDPESASAYDKRSLAFSAKGDFDEAIADLSKAIELDPKFVEAFLNRAAAFRDKQDLERAREDLEAALRLDPQLVSAKVALDEVDRLIAKGAAPPAISLPPAKTTPAAPAAKAPTERMRPSPLASSTLFRLGPVPITRPVVTTWAIMLALTIGSWLATRRLQRRPNRQGAVLEVIVTAIMGQIEDVIRKDSRPYLPLLGTLFIFLATANLSGVLPGVEAPTSKLETPAALALIVFVSVHIFGARAQGAFGYLASFAKPRVIMLPLNIVSQVTRTFSLMVRLFGNVMSGEFVIALVVALAGLFVPIPLMALEVLVGLVQAYIFVVLATVFIGAAIGAVEQG